MRKFFGALALVGFLGVSAAAQTAHVEGDVYLTMRNGQISKIAGGTVRLIGADSVDAAWRECDESAKGKDTQAQAKASEAFAAHLPGFLVEGSAKTGMQAHYKLDSLTPGKHALFAQTTIGTSHFSWVVPFAVTAGQSLTLDLDNSNVTQAGLYCLK